MRLETASIIAARLDLAISVEPLVRERCAFSCDHGSAPDVLRQHWPNLDFAHLDAQWWGEPEESHASIEQRCAIFHAKTADLPDRARIAVISHWGFIRAATGREIGNATFVRLLPAIQPPNPSQALRTRHGRKHADATRRRCRTRRRSPAEAPSPRLTIVTQYIKDFSFENPHAPGSFDQGRSRPEIAVRVDVRAQNLAPERYEVGLQLHVDAKADGEPVFIVELSYAGLFSLANIPQDSLQPVLLIECPRLLFPFARRIVADVTRDGGYPPLMIDPIDFVALYRRRLEQQAKAPGEAAPQAPSPAPMAARWWSRAAARAAGRKP